MEEDWKDRLDIIGIILKLIDHDVLNLVSVIKMATELLELKGSKEEELDEIKAANSKIESMIKLARWAPTLTNIDLHLKAEVKSCFEKALSYFEDIKKEIINNCQASVQIPPSLLTHFFYELIDNSLKHGGEKLTQIKLDCEEKENIVYIKYQDNGIGIDIEKRNRIFLKDTEKINALYLIKGAIKIFGGNIEEKGKIGQGVNFIISIPI